MFDYFVNLAIKGLKAPEQSEAYPGFPQASKMECFVAKQHILDVCGSPGYASRHEIDSSLIYLY